MLFVRPLKTILKIIYSKTFFILSLIKFPLTSVLEKLGREERLKKENTKLSFSIRLKDFYFGQRQL